jgi:hypothetical protein
MTPSTRSWLASSIVAAFVVVAALPAAASTAAPAPLVPSSTSWTSADRGWVLGFRACAEGQCPRLVTTSDGGATWTNRTAPPVKVSERDIQVRIVLAPPAVAAGGSEAPALAYATGGRRVYVTRDGAQTWTKIHLPAVEGRASIGDLVVTPERVYAIVGDGDLDTGRTRLFSGHTTSGRWVPVEGVETVGNAVNVDGGWDVTTDGRAVAVALGRIFGDNAYWRSEDGRAFTSADPPCTGDQVTDLGAVRGADVAALCSYNPGMGHMFKDLFASDDGGPFQPDGSVPDLGLTQEYVSPAPGQHVITAVSGASILYRSTESGWATPLFIGGGVPWADLQFPDRRDGFVVWGGPRTGMGEVYRSTDRGVSWSTLDLP